MQVETFLSNSIKENSYDVCLDKYSKVFSTKNEFLYIYIEKQEGPSVLNLTLSQNNKI